LNDEVEGGREWKYWSNGVVEYWSDGVFARCGKIRIVDINN